MTPLEWVLASLACYRLTLLVTSDAVTQPFRDRLSGRLAVLVSCAWCVSVWLAPLVVGSGLAWADGWGWLLGAGSLSVAAVSGVVATYAAPDG